MNRLASRSYFRDREDEMYCFATVLEEDRVEMLRIECLKVKVPQHSKMPCMVWQPRGFGPMPHCTRRQARRLLQSARFRHGYLTWVGLSSDLDPKSPFEHIPYRNQL